MYVSFDIFAHIPYMSSHVLFRLYIITIIPSTGDWLICDLLYGYSKNIRCSNSAHPDFSRSAIENGGFNRDIADSAKVKLS